MAEVDNKIVSIKFDNASFQTKMSETIASLDKLRASLDMAGAKQGLTDLSNAGKNFSLEGMNASVDGLSTKFLAMATIGITALANIVNSAINAGSQISKSLTISPIGAGFEEFELKMGSIQTIMSGSGASLEVVNQKLQELNEYSDRTIYSFKDMTSNIGKFTNAGVSLDESVAAIQGVANVAALSGANAEEAARGMYNFAQAISTGSVKLMDWKSIELANMGTTEFKQQLIDTSVAMGTLTQTGDGLYKTLEGTEVTTKMFNQTLQDGWLTSEVLTSTLGKFADATTDIGARATAAATDVKTFSQMMSTIKESVGSGWSTSFENIFGNFEEGKELWTSINTSVSTFVGKSADARNEMLKGWKDFGGRTALIDAFKEAFAGLGTILKPIGDAFREIFPRQTAADLLGYTASFAEFAKKIAVTGETAEKIKAAFRGFFALLEIGWEIIKGVGRVVIALASGLWQIFSPLLNLVSGTGSLISSLHGVLVEGEGISTFFDGFVAVIGSVADAISGVVAGVIEFVAELGLFQKVGNALAAPIAMLQKAGEAVKEFFSNLSFGDDASKGVEETGQTLEKTAGFFDRLVEALKNVFGQIGDMFSGFGELIADAFGGLGGAISDALGSGDFGQVLDIIKTGLLGGILTMLYKFFKSGIKLDFGQGAIFEKIKGILDTVTSSLKSLQANVRADTLLKIALAMGVLAIAIIALSLVDGVALAKAMAAIAVGFAQLTAVMLILEKVSAGGGSIKILAMAASFVLLAAAMALLVIPIKILSTMDMGELAQGLIGVSVAMLVMTKAVSLIGSDTANLVKAGISMILISVALIVLAKAIKSFAEMNLTEMALGLAQAALGIGLLILALKQMPDDIAKKGLGLLILAFSLRSLAKVVQLFAGIPLGVLAKGFISISAGLALIGLAMRSFPDDMIKKAAGLVVVSGALYLMGMAIEKVGALPFGTLVKGVLGLSVMLGVLTLAILVLDEAKGGIAALLGAAAGLLVLGMAIEQVGSLPFDVLLKGIVGLAAVLAVLAIASLAAPGILLLGVALMAIGAGIAFISIGVALLGKGFQLMAEFGEAGMGHITAAMQAFIRELPGFVSAFVVGLMQAAVEIGEQFPTLITTIEKILTTILDVVIRLIPKLREVLGQLLDAGIDLFIGRIPGFIEAGFALLTGFLTGMRDNIGEIVTLVAEIVTGFLDAFTEEVPNIVSSLVELLTTVFTEVAFGLGELMPRLMIGVGRSFLEGFWTGITQELGELGELIQTIISDVIGFFTSGFGIFSPSKVMMNIGKNIIRGLLNGIVAMAEFVKTWFIQFPLKALQWIGNLVRTLFNKGIDLISGILSGIVQKAGEVIRWFTSLAGKVLGWIGPVASTLLQKGRDLIGGILRGVNSAVLGLTSFFSGLGGRVVGWLGNMGSRLIGAGRALIQGMIDGVGRMAGALADKVANMASNAVNTVTGFFGIGGPSKVFMEIGRGLGQGMIMGIDDMNRPVVTASERMASNFNDAFTSALDNTMDGLGDMDGFHPVITPVLDLSRVQEASRGIGSIMDGSAVAADVSLQNADYISAVSAVRPDDTSTDVTGAQGDLIFNQIINAPEALSTNDIYRNTKSQFALIKEELHIP